MGTIAIKLDPTILENPDLDLRYLIPERIEKLTLGLIKDNGYDFIDDGSNSLIIFLESKRPQEDVLKVTDILKKENFIDNNIYDVSIIAIDEGNGYKVVHPENYTKPFVE